MRAAPHALAARACTALKHIRPVSARLFVGMSWREFWWTGSICWSLSDLDLVPLQSELLASFESFTNHEYALQAHVMEFIPESTAGGATGAAIPAETAEQKQIRQTESLPLSVQASQFL